jgi:Gpi18-like mannosyltransferase
MSLRGPIIRVLAARLYLFAFIYLFFVNTPLREDRNFFIFQEKGQSRPDREAEIQNSFWERLAPFDGQFYLDISNNGYRTISASLQGDLGNYAFFPLLPTLLAILRLAFPEAYVPLTLLVSFAASIIGTLALIKLGKRCGVASFLAVLVLLTFPSAPYQCVLYTEGIFLCLSGITLIFALERKPWPTILFGLLAGLTRPQGVLLAIPVLVELVLPYEKKDRPEARAPVVSWIATLAPFCGFVVMAIVSDIVSGSPGAFLTVQMKWGRALEAGGFFKAILSIFGYSGPPLDLLGLLVGIGCIPLMWKRLPRSVALYGIGCVLMPLATGSILSFSRFMSVSIPHILALALFLEGRGKRTTIIVLAIFLVLQSLLARGLMGWYFVG